jgi:hypothetical protein
MVLLFAGHILESSIDSRRPEVCHSSDWAWSSCKHENV